MEHLRFYIVVLWIHLLVLPAFAVREVTFRKQTPVYERKDENSKTLGMYERGDTVPISSKNYGDWKKVIVDVDGKKRTGWVLVKDLRGTKVRSSEEREEKAMGPVYRRKTAAGIMGNLSYVYQTSGNLTFETTAAGGINAEYTTLTGANMFIGLFADFPISNKTNLRGYLNLRKMQRSGDAKLAGQTAQAFDLEQDLLSIGSTLKWYSGPVGMFWWGPGLEIGKTNKMTILGSNGGLGEVTGDVSDQPLYVLLTVSAGYDLHLGGQFFLLPEARFGLVPNGDPIVAVIEVVIPVAFTF